RDVAGDVAASGGGRQTGAPEHFQKLGQRLDRDPVKLDVLPDRDVRGAACETASEVRDHPHLLRRQDSVRNPDAHHEVWRGLAFAAGTAYRAGAIALGVDSP